MAKGVHLKKYRYAFVCAFALIYSRTAEAEERNPELDLKYVSDAQLVWDDSGGGAQLNVSVYRPVAPAGYHVLGFFAYGPYSKTPNAFGMRAAIVAKALSDSALKPPQRYQWIGDDHDTGADRDMSWWEAIPAPGYRCLSTVFVPYHGAPKPDEIMCVREDLTVLAKGGRMVYADRHSGGSHDLTLFDVVSENEATGLSVGALQAVPSYVYGTPPKLPSDQFRVYTLKGMPEQSKSGLSASAVKDVIRKQGPVLYLDRGEEFMPANVNDFLKRSTVVNGADRYPLKSDDIARVIPRLMPQATAAYLEMTDDVYRLGDREKATSYVAVRKVHHNLTDIQFWFFYSHNGEPFIRYTAYVRALERFFEQSGIMVPTGEHVGDWEHVTLRVNHETKTVVAVEYASHGDSTWYVAPQHDEEHVRAYSALHTHGTYPVAGNFVELNGWVDKGQLTVASFTDNFCEQGPTWEAYKHYEIVYDAANGVAPPAWTSFRGDWGQPMHHRKEIPFEIAGMTFYPFTYDCIDSGPSTPQFMIDR